jgi:hypothetical protein
MVELDQPLLIYLPLAHSIMVVVVVVVDMEVAIKV